MSCSAVKSHILSCRSVDEIMMRKSIEEDSLGARPAGVEGGPASTFGASEEAQDTRRGRWEVPKRRTQALGIKVYFAKPYHSWERGTNENRNGVVRRGLPKGSPFDAILDEEMRRIDYMLNDRPMKCLGWRMPQESFTSLLKRHLRAA